MTKLTTYKQVDLGRVQGAQETAQGAGPMTYLRTYRITTSTGRITVEAYSVAHAIRTGLELLGGTLRSCPQGGDW